MPEQNFEIKIGTTATGDGAEKTIDGLKRVEAQANATAAATRKTWTPAPEGPVSTLGGAQGSLTAATGGITDEMLKAVYASKELEASTLTSGVNLGRARAEMITLAREMATGTVNMRTVSALAGSLGANLAVAGIVGYEVFQVTKDITEQVLGTDKATESYRRGVEQITGELGKQLATWNHMAAGAENFSDVFKIGEKTIADIDAMSEKAKALHEQSLGWMKEFTIWAQNASGSSDGGMFQREKDERKKVLDQWVQDAINAENTITDKAISNMQEVERLKGMAAEAAIAEITDKIDRAQVKESELSANRYTQEGFKLWHAQVEEVMRYKKLLEEIGKIQDDQVSKEKARQDAEQKDEEKRDADFLRRIEKERRSQADKAFGERKPYESGYSNLDIANASARNATSALSGVHGEMTNVSAATLNKVTEAKNALAKHPDEQHVEELANSVIAFAKTSAGKTANQAGKIDRAIAEIKRLEGMIKTQR